MIKHRFAKGALTLATVIGLAAGPATAGGAADASAVKPHSVQRNFSIPAPNIVVIQKNLFFNGRGTIRIGFRDIGVPGDRFRATYIDGAGSAITGRCAVSSKQTFQESLRVFIPSKRSFKVRIRWCSGPGIFPAGGQMLILP